MLLQLSLLTIIAKSQVPLVYGSRKSDVAVAVAAYDNSNYLNYSVPQQPSTIFCNYSFPSSFNSPALPTMIISIQSLQYGGNLSYERGQGSTPSNRIHYISMAEILSSTQFRFHFTFASWSSLKSVKFSYLLLSSKYENTVYFVYTGFFAYPSMNLGGIQNAFQYEVIFSTPLNTTGTIGGFVSLNVLGTGNSAYTDQYILDMKIDIVNITSTNAKVLAYSIFDANKTYV